MFTCFIINTLLLFPVVVLNCERCSFFSKFYELTCFLVKIVGKSLFNSETVAFSFLNNCWIKYFLAENVISEITTIQCWI